MFRFHKDGRLDIQFVNGRTVHLKSIHGADDRVWVSFSSTDNPVPSSAVAMEATELVDLLDEERRRIRIR